MHYWLMKTEPGTYSFADLQKDGKTSWDGVRNYGARNNMREMQVGDNVFIYHSGDEKMIMGIATVIAPAHADPTDKTGTWECVDITSVKSLKNPVHLHDVKKNKKLHDMKLVTHGRLSVQPVTKEQWDEVLSMAQ